MDHGGHDHGGDASGLGPACKISMLWNWYTIDACFLSSSWHITSQGAFAATCIGVVLLVVVLEGLRRLGREYDEHIQREFASRMALIANGGVISGGVVAGATPAAAAAAAAAASATTPSGAAPPASSSSSSSAAAAACPAVRGAEQGQALLLAPQAVTFRASPLQQLVRAVIHAATFGVAYIVMLLAMYYNGYIIICILIGALLGKFLCDWMAKTVVIGGPEAALGKGGNAPTGIEEPTVCCG